MTEKKIDNRFSAPLQEDGGTCNDGKEGSGYPDEGTGSGGGIGGLIVATIGAGASAASTSGEGGLLGISGDGTVVLEGAGAVGGSAARTVLVPFLFHHVRQPIHYVGGTHFSLMTITMPLWQ